MFICKCNYNVTLLFETILQATISDHIINGSLIPERPVTKFHNLRYIYKKIKLYAKARHTVLKLQCGSCIK